MAAAPNPQRRFFPGSGTLPKVFIAYPHNPDLYVQIDPTVDQETIQRNPGVPVAELQARIFRQIQEHERAQMEKIQSHKRLVSDFAKFLNSSGVAVAHDQLLTDVGSENIMKWCQEQIEDSDYLILIVTESFKDFLENEVPPETEHLFVGHTLYNIVHNPSKKLLPVFLDRVKDVELVPVCLQASTLYEIWTPFDVRLQRRDDLHSLYSLLTNQQTKAPKPVGPVALPPRPRVGGGGRSRQQPNSVLTPHHRQLFNTLCTKQPQVLSDQTLATIAEKRAISTHWKQLAKHLGLTEAEVERCEARGAGHDDTSEMCLQMFKTWKDKCVPLPATLAGLADTVFNKYKNVSVFEDLYEVFRV